MSGAAADNVVGGCDCDGCVGGDGAAAAAEDDRGEIYSSSNNWEYKSHHKIIDN